MNTAISRIATFLFLLIHFLSLLFDCNRYYIACKQLCNATTFFTFLFFKKAFFKVVFACFTLVNLLRSNTFNFNEYNLLHFAKFIVFNFLQPITFNAFSFLQFDNLSDLHPFLSRLVSVRYCTDFGSFTLKIP